MNNVRINNSQVLTYLQEDAYINNLPVTFVRNDEITNVYITAVSELDTVIYRDLIYNYSNLIDLHNKMLTIDNDTDGIYDLDELLSIWLNDILVNVYKTNITIDSFMYDFVELVSVAETNNIDDIRKAIQHLDDRLMVIRHVSHEYNICDIQLISSAVGKLVYKLDIPTPKAYGYIKSLTLKNEVINSIKYNNGDIIINSPLYIELDNIFNSNNDDIDYITVYVNTFFKHNDIYNIYRQKCVNCNRYVIHKA